VSRCFGDAGGSLHCDGYGMPPDPIAPLKRQLADEILGAVARLNVSIAARVLDIDASRFADLRHGRIQRFSVERLIRMLAVIERRVSLTVVNAGDAEVRWFRMLNERRASRRSGAPP
jgi:predicted XRE-type DNA-binding protein